MEVEAKTIECEVCGGSFIKGNPINCDRQKNGYCAAFLLQAEKDKQQFNVHNKTKRDDH